MEHETTVPPTGILYGKPRRDNEEVAPPRDVFILDTGSTSSYFGNSKIMMHGIHEVDTPIHIQTNGGIAETNLQGISHS